MNTEAEIYRILVQFWLKQITILEAKQQLMDLFESPKKMECDICHKNKANGIVSFICNDCDANEEFEDYEI